MKEFIKTRVLNYLPARLAAQVGAVKARPHEYLDWLSADLTGLAERFVAEQGLLESEFTRGLGEIFATRRFELLLKKWVTDYLFQVFGALESGETLRLEDNPIHRFAAAEYAKRFGRASDVRWAEPAKTPVLSGLAQALTILWLALRRGVRISSKREDFVVLREANWGLQGRGRHFHDDFVVDGEKIKAEGLLLFSREGPCGDRAIARAQARTSEYAHFDLPRLRIGLGALFGRIFPLYIGRAVPLLIKSVRSPNFSLFSSMFSTFVANAVPYERLFSNYRITSELGHNLFSPSHIAEAIVCEAYGTAYFLINWSDLSLRIDQFWLAYLGCDRYLVWGPAHVQGVEVEPSRVEPIGYYFKDRIVALRDQPEEKKRLLDEMGVPAGKRIVSFFDETFGGDIKMTEEHYIVFWESILAAATRHPETQVVIKPKGTFFHDKFSPDGFRRYEPVRRAVEALANVSILDPMKWSFIEAIGVSDLVVTQGMTSSATIALMCGVDGLYFDQARYDHPFAERFKGRLVFDEPAALLDRIDGLLSGTGERPTQVVPEDLMRRYDAYADERGIDRLREALAGGLARLKASPSR